MGVEDRHNRRSIRLRDYDYATPGAYFVTICASERGCLFGGVADGEIRLTREGQVAYESWVAIPDHIPLVSLDAFIIMPDHIHGILVIAGRGDDLACELPAGDVGARHAVPLQNVERFGHPVVSSVPTIVRSFKAATTKRINEMRDTPGAAVWQRNYYEHIVRDEADLDRVRKYIAENPVRWEDVKDKSWRE